MKKEELFMELKNAVKEKEHRLLTEDEMPHISAHNRSVMLEILDSTEQWEGEVSAELVRELKDTLEAYLGIYMAEQKESWKWIILSCVYLSFLRQIPLHAQESVHYMVREENGAPAYYCPMREEAAGSVCLFCVCKVP